MSRTHRTTSPAENDPPASTQPAPAPARTPEQTLAHAMARGATTGAARAVVEWLLNQLSDRLG